MIRKAEMRDLPLVAELAGKLWPGHAQQELEEEFAEAGRIICFTKKL